MQYVSGIRKSIAKQQTHKLQEFAVTAIH